MKKMSWLFDGLELVYFNDKFSYYDGTILFRFKKRIDGSYFIEIGLTKISESGISIRDLHKCFPINDLKGFERTLEKHFSYRFNRKTEKFFMDDLVPFEKYVGIDYDKLLMNSTGYSRFKNSRVLGQNLNYLKTEMIKLTFGTFKCNVFNGYSKIKCLCQFESKKPGLCTNCCSKYQPISPGGCIYCNDTGLCKFCEGADKNCLFCKGTGLCDTCKGTNICIICSGTGVCYFCKGTKWSKDKYKITVWYEVNTGIKLKSELKKENELFGFEYLQYIGPKNILDQYRINRK